MERFALVASLKPDSQERAAALSSVQPSKDPRIRRTSVFLASNEVFVLEGTDVADWESG